MGWRILLLLSGLQSKNKAAAQKIASEHNITLQVRIYTQRIDTKIL
jgi:hypothetical protein